MHRMSLTAALCAFIALSIAAQDTGPSSDQAGPSADQEGKAADNSAATSAAKDVQTAAANSKTLSVTLSGTDHLAGVYRDQSLGEASGLFPQSDIFATMLFNLALDVKIDGGIALHTEVANQPFTPALDNSRLGSNNFQMFVERLYVKADEFLFPKCSFMFGIQDVRWDPTGRGNPLFLDVINSPNALSSAASIYLSGTGFVPTRRQVSEPVGARLDYNGETIGLGAGYFLVTPVSVGSVNKNHVGYIMADLKPTRSSSLAVILATFDGGQHGIPGPVGYHPMYTAGVSFNSYNLTGLEEKGQGLDFGLEIYKQFGQGLKSGTQKVGFVGLLAKLAARYTKGQYWVEGSWLRITGDDKKTPETYEGFVSYEFNEEFVILESIYWGLNFNQNYVRYAVRGGYAFPSESPKWGLSWGIGKFDAERQIGGTSAYGTELDLTVERRFSKQVSVYLTGAALLSSDVLQKLTTDRSDQTWTALLGTKIAF